MIPKSNNGLVWWNAVMAFLTTLSSAAAFSETIGPKVSGLIFALVGALHAGTAAYVAGAKPVATDGGTGASAG